VSIIGCYIAVKCKAQKGTFHVRTGHEDPQREKRYSSILPLTSALDGDGWSTPRPGRFTPRKDTRLTLYRRLGRPQGRSGRVQKISLPNRTRTPDRAARSESLYRLSQYSSKASNSLKQPRRCSVIDVTHGLFRRREIWW
jgi:hypothetical protein